MPRSYFLGRVPPDGAPMWTDEDRAYALAWLDYERDLCKGCGQSLTKSTHKDNQFGYGGEIVRCHSCAAQARTVHRFVDDGNDQSGVMFRMTTMPD